MITDEFQKKCADILNRLKKEFASIRANRPTPALVENILVEYYGRKLPLKQLASISIVPPREIQLQVWDKEALNAAVKSIETSPLGLTANTEGNTIKLYLPELSRERREELSRLVKKETEKYRIELRRDRDEANKKIQELFNSKEISEDQKFKLKDVVQKQIDKTNEEVEKLLENKIREINE